MSLMGRILLAVISFGLAFGLVANLAFSLFADRAPQGFRIAVGLGCAALVAGAVWQATAGTMAGLGTAMLKGAGLLGTIGFVGGYVGPMILTPEANQGPLLGIFITGPIGFVLGGIAGAVWWGLKSG